MQELWKNDNNAQVGITLMHLKYISYGTKGNDRNTAIPHSCQGSMILA
jgi:hypothetical protein